MKLSWSHKIFLNINKQIGRRPFLDWVMHVFGHELIFILGLLVFLWASTDLYTQNPALLNQFIKLLMTSVSFAFILSWGIAIIFPRPRPIIEFPKIQQLIRPLGTWKSFPSDHTIMSFILAGIVNLMGPPLWFGVLVILLAFFVAFGRVYVGVHYPRDIIGGLVLAIVFVFSSKMLLEVVTQPLYNAIIQIF